MAGSSNQETGSVYLYVPNVIGYIRVILNCVAFSVCYSQKSLSAILYVTSFVCDALDGWFARRLNQGNGDSLYSNLAKLFSSGNLVVNHIKCLSSSTRSHLSPLAQCCCDARLYSSLLYCPYSYGAKASMNS
ncbi:uncharacterized protein LOC122011412 [Zingiber officinale]|uniref:uncharacterized protein LOC122011412 n=1 Tax=Zingiber officinale TaxID=94328 RepID=UPI001C4D91FD|nr:uncharacterized protein LOC122011412 [Zingiber officinale]